MLKYLLFFISITLFSTPIVENIKFEGLKKISETVIKSYLKTQEGRPFIMSFIKDDIKNLFEKKLFSDISVDCVTINNKNCDETSEKVILTYILKENPTINTITIEGNKEINLKELENVILIRKNTLLNNLKVQESIQNMISLYKEKGFFSVNVVSKLENVENNKNDVKFIIEENPKPVVKNITFIGNKSINDAELKDLMLIREFGVFRNLTDLYFFKEKDFEKDIENLKLYYQEKGFFKASVSETKINLSKDKKYINVIIYITEGNQYNFGTFTIKSDFLDYKEYELLKPFKLLESKKFKKSEIINAIKVIHNMYEKKGYSNILVSTQISINEVTKIINFSIIIEKSKIKEPDLTKSKIILEE